MRLIIGLAVTGLLVPALPAAAKDQRVEGGERQPQKPAPPVSRHAAPNLSESRVAAEAAQPGSQMISSVPLAPNADLGLGLFSIVGQTEKEMVRSRTQPRLDVRPKDGRVAAVGFSLRF